MSSGIRPFWWADYLEPTGLARDARTKGERYCARWLASVGTTGDPECISDLSHSKNLTPMEMAACIAWKHYRDANPTLSARELLGLPSEEPAPAKPMGKAEIAETIRSVRRDWGRLPKGADDLLSMVTVAVEGLPEPGKVSPFAERVADYLGSYRKAGVRQVEPLNAARQIHAAFSSALSDLLVRVDGMATTQDKDLLSGLARLAGECQRAAEDLDLISKQ